MVRAHYLCRRTFTEIHRAYEERVAAYVKKSGKTRENLRLSVSETRSLFETSALDHLIDDGLERLRDFARTCFGDEDDVELYDSRVSRIYHELAILREEHRSVRNFPREGSRREFTRLFNEISEYYPERLRRVKKIFASAERRLEELLPRYAEDRILLRSAYLFRTDLWPDGSRGALARFLGKMFPDAGEAHGFLQVARSFLRAGFFDEAEECARMGVAVAGKKAQARTTRAKEVRETIAELDRLTARAAAERQALQEEASGHDG